MRVEATVLTFSVHQHELGGVPKLVAEVAVALAALAVEVHRAAQAGQRREGEAQRIGAVAGNAFWEFLSVALRTLGRFRACASRWCVCPAAGQGNAVDQVNGVQHIAFGLRHLVALGIAHQAVDVDVLEGHLPVKCLVIMIIRATQKKMMS